MRLLVLLAFAACSNGEAGVEPDGGGFDLTVAEPDLRVSSNYPAHHDPVPLVSYGGGPLLLHPHIVTITFAGDTRRSQLEQFGDFITASSWWTAVSAEYCAADGGCIGAGTSEHVVITAQPQNRYTVAEIYLWLKARIVDGTLPQPSPDVYYAVYLPPGVVVTNGSASSCGIPGFDGYHDWLTFDSGGDAGLPDGGVGGAAFGVVPDCNDGRLFVAASHELIEAATDPGGGNGYAMHRYAWTLSAGSEVGDLCTSLDPIMESGIAVTRSWSNASAMAGHDPCVPRPPGEVYFNVAPSKGNDALWLSVGQTITFELDAFSEAPVSDWTISVTPPKGTLDVLLSASTVNNGSTVQMIITALGQSLTHFTIDSSGPDGRHSWPMVVVPNPF